MHQAVEEYLTRSSADTRQRMANHYAAEVTEFSRLVGLLISLLGRFQSMRPEYDKEAPYHPAYGLMTKSANTLGAGFELVLNGYHWEPPALYRTAIEGFAVAWDIVHNPARFDLWKEDRKFDSTKSISNVKEVSSEIGKMYGLLSKMNTHTSPLNSSPAMFGADEPKIQFFGLITPGKEDRRKTEVYFALFVSFVCLQLTELTFHQYSDSHETIEILPNMAGARTKVSQTHRAFVDEIQAVFRGLADGSFQWF